MLLKTLNANVTTDDMLSSLMTFCHQQLQPVRRRLAIEKQLNLIDSNALGRHLATARKAQGLTQGRLATRACINRIVLNRIERGQSFPSLNQLLSLAKTLELPVQWFLSGATRSGPELEECAIELSALGIVDLFVPGARVPGAFRSQEELLALVVGETEPEPRILEAIPAGLAWVDWSPRLLLAYGREQGRHTAYRLAWLADVALTIDRQRGFPGGCRSRARLARLIQLVRSSKASVKRRGPDSLGRPATGRQLSPVWKRWQITYAADLETFRNRAAHLHELRVAAGRTRLIYQGTDHD